MTRKNKMIQKVIMLFIIMGGYFLQTAAQNIHTLKNQTIEFSVDDSGKMVVLKNLQTGHNYADGESMWRLYFDRGNQKGVEVLADENQPEVYRTGSQIEIVYNSLRAKGEVINFALILKIFLEKDRLKFSSQLANNEEATVVRELQYPLIGNTQLPPDHQLLTTLKGGHIYGDPVKKIQSINISYRGPDHHYRQLELTYPIGVSANCFALMGRNQGLYFGSHDTTFQYTGHGLRLYPNEDDNFEALETGLYKYPDCLPGETWSNDANVIIPYNGDWHKTSKIYRKWADTWWKHSEEPTWVKQMKGFQRIILKHQNGEILFPYDEFGSRVKEEGKKAGIDVAFPFGWWDSGMDNGYPDSYYIMDGSQGGEKAWKQAVADYKKDGGKVLMYYNGKLIDTESEYYTNGYGKEVCYKNSTGEKLTEAYRFPGEDTFTGLFNNRSFVVADTKDSRWKRQLIKMADHAIELGANSVFYDQLGYVERASNWDLSKELPVLRKCIIADKANALKMIHEHIDKIDSEVAIGTEWITDVTSQHVDYVHGIFGMGSATGSTHANFIDWFRYTFPEVIISDRDIDGDEKDIKWLVNRSVMYGLRTNVQIYRLRGLISDVPYYQNYLAKINQLREKYSDLLMLGKYTDSEGFAVDEKTAVEARSFVNDNKMAIVMTHKYNTSDATQVVCPGYEYLEYSGIGDAEVIMGTDDKQHVRLGKDGIAVLIYEKE